MPHNDSFRPQPRNELGTAALVLGLVAVVVAVVPVIGTIIAAPCALLALTFGLLGLLRVAEGTATNTGVALTGGILGLGSTIMLVVSIAAMIGPM